jgi:predicted nucleic acid-binding protein
MTDRFYPYKNPSKRARDLIATAVTSPASSVIAAAIEGQCSVLYSEDLQHEMRIGELVVSNPFL